ncbi:hypothetical protein [Stratiformator vulcanicus]|uniref:Uncharacterized protein n=1 Tax=Stratiformator vulcanicus TaxID=2527980 RepID=A0A517R7E3_9PLAN|nr:hypothetical protein [Stratiformator vulcanicus]QDT39817.1 hypothetical protein Pan189_42290 [Stratiformator vulcanicus]
MNDSDDSSDNSNDFDGAFVPEVVVEDGVPQGNQSTAVLIALGITLTLVVGASILTVPGIGIALLILGLVPLARTVIVVRQRSQFGRDTSTGKTIGMFLLSSAVTLGLAWFLCGAVLLASFLAFFVVCWGVIGTSQALPQEMAEFVLFAAPITAGVLSLLFGGWMIWQVARARYKHDLKRD